MQVLRIRAGGETWALDTSPVVELVPAIAPRPVPGFPEPLVGVVEWRGRVLPVLDLARHLGLGGTPPLLSRRIVVVDLGGPATARAAADASRPVLGLLVEEAARVATLEAGGREEAAEPLPPPRAGLGRLVRGPEGLVQLVEARELVPPALLAALLERAASGAAAP